LEKSTASKLLKEELHQHIRSEAANGVIQIFTKKGTPGPAKWSINITSGYDLPNTKFVTEQFVKDNVLKDGLYQSYSVNTSGGNQAFTYNVGGKIFMNDGVIVDYASRMKSYNFNGGLRAMLSEISTVELSTSYTKTQFNRTNNNNSYYSPYGAYEDASKN
jgi:hypothetical protein